MSNCKYCGSPFKSKGGLTRHEKSCGKNPEKVSPRQTHSNRDCPHCGKRCKTMKGQREHEKHCSKNPDGEARVVNLGGKSLPCKFCGKTFKNKQGLGIHIKGCVKNPDQVVVNPKVEIKATPCVHCGQIYTNQSGLTRHQNRCPKNPLVSPQVDSIHEISPHASNTEMQLHKFISQEVFSGEIPITSLQMEDRSEFDICVESRKVLIEFNGSYWHSSANKNMYVKKHSNKVDVACDLGYKLFHVSEHQWNNQKDIWKSMLRLALNPNRGVVKYGARELEFRKFPNDEAREFLNENHLQGFRSASESYGLFLSNGVLVSMMSFSWNRSYKMNEMIRFATLKNTVVVGGAQKLFKNYLAHSRGSVLSYARRDYCSEIDNVYQRLGFKLLKVTDPGYQYVHPSKLGNGKFLTHIKSREAFQKHKLLRMIEEGSMKKPNGSLTERTITEHNKWFKFYDSGNLVYVYDRK